MTDSRSVITSKAMLLMSAMLVHLNASPLFAEPILDQSNLMVREQRSYGDIAIYWAGIAQSFTVGRAGLLSHLDLYLSKTAGLKGDVKLELKHVINGVPDTGSPIFQTLIDLADLPRSVDPQIPIAATTIDLAPFGLFVQPEEQYAIVLSRDDGSAPPWALWRTGQPSTAYERGDVFIRNHMLSWERIDDTEDMAFATYVNPIAEPASYLLGLFGVVGLQVNLRRIRRRRAI
jgi:hypothetical protein